VDDEHPMNRDHSAPHGGEARYLRDASRLSLPLRFDRCGVEREQMGGIHYRPSGRRLVGQLAELTARELQLEEHTVSRVRFAALICDVGRDQIPAKILHKRAPLNDEEWLEVRRQPELGAALLSDTSLDDIREWVLARRERPDGRGYPRGLSGDQIPVEARILAVTDAYIAMVSGRPHRAAKTQAAAEQELRRNAGTQFDASVVEAFIHAWHRRGAQPQPITT
jgi:HD-GYP domain-containing protein (c-di-GMP phosphodiesterase class II)